MSRICPKLAQEMLEPQILEFHFAYQNCIENTMRVVDR